RLDHHQARPGRCPVHVAGGRGPCSIRGRSDSAHGLRPRPRPLGAARRVNPRPQNEPPLTSVPSYPPEASPAPTPNRTEHHPMSSHSIDGATLTAVQDLKPGDIVEHHRRYWSKPRRVEYVAPQRLYSGPHTIVRLAHPDPDGKG